MTYGDDRLRGVGGWLAFLVISLMALGPLAVIAGTLADLGTAEQVNPPLSASGWQFVEIVDWGLALIQIAMMVYTGWRLNKVFRRSTVKFAIVMLWAMGPGLGLLGLAAIGLFANVNPFDSSTLSALARPIIYAFVWTLYLMMSRRVENTYDEEGPEVEAEADLANVFE